MPLPSGKLLDEEVNAILIASGKSKRHRKRKLSSLMPQYETKIRKTAEIQLAEWRENGVSKLEWDALMTECPLLIPSFNLFICDDKNYAYSSSQIDASPLASDNELQDFDEDMPLVDDDEEPIEEQENLEESWSLFTILRHFAVFTDQKHSHLTYFFIFFLFFFL